MDYGKNFNYINFNCKFFFYIAIKSKQRHGYDIINCIPSQQV